MPCSAYVFFGWIKCVGKRILGTLIEDNALSYANFSRIFMSITGSAYLAISIQSFIFARKQREMDTAETV